MRAYARKPASGSTGSDDRPASRGERRRAARLQAEQTRLHRSALAGSVVLTAGLLAAILMQGTGAAVNASEPAGTSGAVALSDSASSVNVTWRPSSKSSQKRSSTIDLGTVSGQYTLIGPASVPDGGKVMFLLSGPARVLRVADAAPYTATIDTTTIPDGAYRLTVGVMATRHHQSQHYRLRVANGATPAPTASATVPAPPTSAAPPQSSEPSIEPTAAEPTTAVPTTAVPTTAVPTTAVPTTAVPTTAAPTTTEPTTAAPTTAQPTTAAPTTAAPTTAPTTPPTTAPTAIPYPTKPVQPTITATMVTVKPTTPAATPASGPAAEVLSQTNAQRVANGCAALTVDARLTSAAQAHSQDMATNNYFAHNSQDGRSPFDRMTAAGYRFSTAGENIAMGYRTASDVMTGWMNSPGHRANILNCSFTNIGIGYATTSSGTPYWTQDFGRPA